MKSKYLKLVRLLVITSMTYLLPTIHALGAPAKPDQFIPIPDVHILDKNPTILFAGESQEIILLGEPLDEDGPLTTNLSSEPNPAEINQPLFVSATVDDSYYGGSLIASAQYSLDNGANWSSMNAVDGNYDQVSEGVEAISQAPTTPGTYSLCIRGTDINGNTGLNACADFVVFIPDLLGPEILDLKLDPNPALPDQSVTLSAAISDQTTGGSAISGGEYSLDDGENWLALASADGQFDEVSENVAMVLQAPAQAGNASYCMRGRDENDNTGQVSCVTLVVYTPDQVGPSTIDLVADPNPQEAGQELLISAVIDDRFTGNSPIQAAEYSLDNGLSWHTMQVSDGAWDENVEGVWAQVNAPEPAGYYDLCVRGQDSNGDTGPKTCLALQIIAPDNMGPITSGVTVEPEPVEIKTQFTLIATIDESSTGGMLIQSAQYSLDSGGNWSEMIAQDSAFDEVLEFVTVSVTAPDEAGDYDICVRGIDQDANIGESECTQVSVYATTAQKDLTHRLSFPLLMANFQH